MADDAADDRWTVRGVPKRMREAVTEAAQRDKVSVGEWACEAFNRRIQGDREPLDLTLRPMADKSADKADALSDADARLATIERAVASAVALAGARGVPKAFRQEANHLLRESLPVPLTTVAVSDRRPRLGAPAPAPNGKIEPGADQAFGHG